MNKTISEEELEIIIEGLNKSDGCAENMYFIHNNFEYDLKEIYNEGWSDEGKCSTNFFVYALRKDEEDTGMRLGQFVTRYGSYYSDYDWDYESVALVKGKEVTIKKWVYC